MDALDLVFTDFFSGIGGVSLAAEAAGFTVAAHCEIEPFCRRVLHKHWPDVPCWEDIHDVTAATIRDAGIRRIDCAHFSPPCQSLSVAGKQAAADDPRYLWPQVVRVLTSLGDSGMQPAGLLIENVDNVARLVLDDWLADLESLGYDAGAVVVPAAAVGAPHLRYRLFILAYAASFSRAFEQRRTHGGALVSASPRTDGGTSRWSNAQGTGRSRRTDAASAARIPGSGALADAERIEPQRGRATGDVAHTSGGDEGETLQRQRLRDTVGHSRPAMANPSRESGDGTGKPGQGRRSESSDRREYVADTTSARRGDRGCNTDRSARDETRGPQPERLGSAAGGQGVTQSGLGGEPHELPRWMDRRGLAWHGWPALPGQPQHPYEPPRTTGKEPNRRKRLQALGNAVPAMQVYPILCAIHDALTGAANSRVALP